MVVVVVEDHTGEGGNLRWGGGLAEELADLLVHVTQEVYV